MLKRVLRALGKTVIMTWIGLVVQIRSNFQLREIGSMGNFAEIVEKRRSVRLFDGGSVPEEVVQRCLDLAMKSASSSNLQPWEFYWVRSQSVRSELVKVCMAQPAAGTAGELIVCVARTRAWERVRAHTLEQLKRFKSQGLPVADSALDYYSRLIPMIYSVGFKGLIKLPYFFFKGLKTPMVRGPISERDMEVWAVKSTSLACQTLMLAFQSEGYDTCPMEGFDSHRLHKLLSLPGDAYPVMVLGVGKARLNSVALPRIRAEREWFVKVV